jgi:hypothetical protein
MVLAMASPKVKLIRETKLCSVSFSQTFLRYPSIAARRSKDRGVDERAQRCVDGDALHARDGREPPRIDAKDV